MYEAILTINKEKSQSFIRDILSGFFDSLEYDQGTGSDNKGCRIILQQPFYLAIPA